MSMTTNLWKRLKEVLPDEPLLIGEVIAVTSYGANVELPDGSNIAVRGDAQVGQKVFVRAGVIEGQAPALSVVEIEI